MGTSSTSRSLRTLPFVILSALAIAGAQVRAQDDASESNPLVIAKQGYFFAGGSYYNAADGQFMSGQMYVEFEIPQNVKHRYPIVLIHGGGLTGTYMMGTPDGREGWNSFFLRQGYAVYVVDQTGRGKSAYHADAYGPLSRGNALGIQQRFTAFELYNMWPRAHLHTQWPGPGLIGDPIFDQFYASEVEGIATSKVQQSTIQAAAAALLDRIGPAIIPLNERTTALSKTARIGQFKRCPGGSEQAAVDGSNVWPAADQHALDCKESARATGPIK